MPTCHRVRKPVKVGTDKREPGDLVPEALSWRGHVLARMEQTQFIEKTWCDEDELIAALSYCAPEIYKLHGYHEPPYASEEAPEEPTPEVWVEEPDEPAEDLLDEPEPLISGGESDRPSRAELEALEWDALKDLAKAHPDLKGNSPRELIIDTLAGE